MTIAADAAAREEDCSRERDAFAAAILAGLSGPRKTLPCRYFYDARGSALFEAITLQPEYYLSRAEARILARHAGAIAHGNGEGTTLVEFGSGSSRKTEFLLYAMPRLANYVPIDVCADALIDARRRLTDRFANLRVRPVLADFSRPLALPADLRAGSRLGFFPGSTIGNFEPEAAAALLAAMRTTLGARSRLIVGVDMVKDERRLLDAYDDRAGLTAAFNLNLLARINRTFGASIDLEQFEHRARYDAERQRVEMHLVSRTEQSIELLGRTFHLRQGETIHTENSHKYTEGSFARLAAAAGWQSARTWSDPEQTFGVFELTAPGASVARPRS